MSAVVVFYPWVHWQFRTSRINDSGPGSVITEAAPMIESRELSEWQAAAQRRHKRIVTEMECERATRAG